MPFTDNEASGWLFFGLLAAMIILLIADHLPKS